MKESKAVISHLEIIARDHGSNQTVQVLNQEGVVFQNCTLNFNSIEANAMQNSARKYIEEELEATQKILQDVHMYWADARFLSEKQHGKVVIEDIDKKARNCVFKNPEDKLTCTSRDPEHPLVEWQNLLFRVDAKVLSVGGAIKAYEVLKVYSGTVPLD